MTEAEFYLFIFNVIHRRKLPLKYLDIDWSESNVPAVMLTFQKVGHIKIDANGHNIEQYRTWLNNIKRAVQ